MIIGISGSHSQGKTTLVNALQQRVEFKDFVFKSGLTRDLHKLGIPINELGTDVTQLYVMCKHYEYSKSSGDVVLDRCALDGLAYTGVILQNHNDSEFLSALGTIARKCFNAYDIIFYVRPELALEYDGTRTIDQNFFDQIVGSFNYWLDVIKTYNNPVRVVELYGSVEQRVEQVIAALKNNNLMV